MARDNLSDLVAGERAIIHDHHFEAVGHGLRIECG
jgi:hypothetical protein